MAKQGHAKFIYLNEGNNNIVVLYKVLTHTSSDEDLQDLITYFDNKVLRIKKSVKQKYKKINIIPRIEEYEKYVYNYVAQKDEKLAKYTAYHFEIKLSNELISVINAHIEDARNKMIQEAKKNYPLKTFQGIDMDLKEAVVMPSLSSQYSSSEKGAVKHIELKLGLIVPKPHQHSFVEYVTKAYLNSPSYKEDKNLMSYINSNILGTPISRFVAKQVSLVVNKKQKKVCWFDPYALLTNDFDRIKGKIIVQIFHLILAQKILFRNLVYDQYLYRYLIFLEYSNPG